METSTTKITKNYIKEHPYIKGCLKRGLINYSALARKISSDLGIEKTSSKEAILVASRRYQEDLKKEINHEKKISKILKSSETEIKNKVAVFILKKSIHADTISDIQVKAKKDNSLFYFLESSDNYTIIVQEKESDYIKKTIKKEIIEVNADLVLLNIKSPKTIENVHGVLAYLTSLFSENNVNIIEFMSCWTDTLFIISKKDLPKTIEFLNL